MQTSLQAIEPTSTGTAPDNRFPNSDLAKAVMCLQNKQAIFSLCQKYYDGDQPLIYSSQKLREIFKNIDAYFMENWCRVVVGAPLDRIALTGITTPNESANNILSEVWEAQQLDLVAHDVHEDALVCPEAFIIAWPNAEGELEVFRNDPAQVHVEYAADNPRKKIWAAKWWIGADKLRYVTMYYPNKLAYFRSINKAENASSEHLKYEAYAPDGEGNEVEAANEYGVIPVFHFRATSRGVSTMKDAISIQDAINKLFNDMMIAGEFAALPQRYAITNQVLSDLKNKAGSIHQYAPSDGISQPTQVGQFEAADLNNFIKAIENRINALSAITQTPKHYFFQQNGEVSGEALMTMEAPLIKKVERYIRRFQPVWQELGDFILAVNGTEEVEAKEIKPNFASPKTVQPKTQAEIRKANVDSGIPLEISLKWEGKTDEEIKDIMAAVQKEKRESMTNLAAALREQGRNFDGGNQEA